MKIFRNLTSALTLAAIVAVAMLNAGCEYAKKVIAKDKVNQGAILYNQGHTKRAQEFFKGATETDPDSPIAWLYYGATLVKEYQDVEGNKEEDEKKKEEIANQAIDIYKRALSLAKNNCVIIDNAVLSIATIYDDLKSEEERRKRMQERVEGQREIQRRIDVIEAEWRNWMQQRAENQCAKREDKATAYYSIAVRYWKCSSDETVRYRDKTAKDPLHYRNMDYKDALPDKQRAEACVANGLEYIEKALREDPEYVDAMLYEGLLYRERQMLTKEESKRKELDQMAVKIYEKASALQKKKGEAADQPQQQAAPKG